MHVDMSRRLIVVIGATGRQGGSVARTFASKPGWSVRGITRKPDSPAVDALRDLGIQMVAADLDDPASLDKAFEGASVIFANTDFWQFLSDPSTFSAAEATNKKPNQIAMDREIQQGKHAVDAAVAHLKTLDLFIWSTLSDTKRWSKDEYTWNLHFDSKATVTRYIQDVHPSLAAKTSYLYVGPYLQNWRMNTALQPHKTSTGTFTMSLPKAFENYVAPLSDPSHDTGLFVDSLVDKPAGQAMLGCCTRITYGDYWRTWAKLHSVDLQIQDRDFEFGGMPDWLQWQFRDDFFYTANYSFTGGDQQIKDPEDLGVDMSKLTNLEVWIRQEDYSSIL